MKVIFDPDFWHEVFSTLRKNPLRTVLTSVGVGWGVIMLIGMSGAGKGLKNGATEGFGTFATNSAFVWTQKTGEPYKGFKRGRIWDLTNEDMDYLRNNVTDIQYLAPRLQGWRQSNTDNTIRDERSGSFYIKGDYPSYRKIDPFTMIYGRFINDLDIKLKRKNCIIGERVYEVMFDKNEDPIGKYLKVNGVYFKVVGVFKPETDMSFGGEKEETIFMPFTTLQQTYNYGNTVHFFSVTAKPGVSVGQLEEEIISELKVRHSIAPNDTEAIGHFNVETMFKSMNALFSGIDILTWIVSLLTLFFGALGVSNIMLIIIKERTHEIGIQRAVGATPANIIRQIVTESVVLTTLAGYIGMLIGLTALELINVMVIQAKEANPDNTIIFADPSVSLGMAITALLFLVIIGALAGILPARRAVKIKTIDALRDE